MTKSAWVPAFAGMSGFLVAIVLAMAVALPARADPKFPPLTGRVVDDAQVLSPQVEQQLTDKLQTLEATTGRQLVVATVPSLQGYPIEDFGYQLGRAWGIGEKGKNTGAILLIAPTERKVRIEVGYGLEPVLTDALSSVIIQTQVLPKFRDGDLPAGVVAGTNAIIEQLSLPVDQAKVRIQQASQPQQHASQGSLISGVLIVMFVIFVLSGFLQSRRGRGGVGSALPWIILGALNSGGRGSDNDWGSGGGGGGGFSGGGGSFGGGGSSGSW